MPELPRTLPEPATSLLLRSEGLDEQHTIQPGKKKQWLEATSSAAVLPKFNVNATGLVQKWCQVPAWL